MIEDARAFAIAAVREELAQMQAARQPVPLRPRRKRRMTGGSIVYSIRLDPDEVAALEARAAALRTKPTALARNFIRNGLGARDGQVAAAAVDRLDAALDELRAALAATASPCGGTTRKAPRRWRR